MAKFNRFPSVFTVFITFVLIFTGVCHTTTAAETESRSSDNTASEAERPAGLRYLDNAILEANKRHTYFTDDEEEIRAYEMREMALMDEKARLQYARNEGLEIGKEEQNIIIARNALIEGASMDFVQKITGLGTNIIKDLCEELSRSNEKSVK